MWLRETAQGRSVLARVSGVLTPKEASSVAASDRVTRFEAPLSVTSSMKGPATSSFPG